MYWVVLVIILVLLILYVLKSDYRLEKYIEKPVNLLTDHDSAAFDTIVVRDKNALTPQYKRLEAKGAPLPDYLYTANTGITNIENDSQYFRGRTL